MYKLLILMLVSASAYSKPRVRLTPDRIDFGVIQQGEILTKEIKVSNEYSEKIKIEGIYESCGCLFVRAQEMTIEPKSSKLFTVYNA